MLQIGASDFISKFTHQLFQELPTASCGLQQMEFAQLDVLTCLVWRKREKRSDRVVNASLVVNVLVLTHLVYQKVR